MRTQYQEFIRKVLEAASKIAQDHFGRVSRTTKAGDPNQVLTKADLVLGKFLIDSISRLFPEHNIIDEEGGAIDNKSEYTWVIDPIDGTSNFARGVQLYGIMIGLLREATPIAGGIALPAFLEICVAEKGKGAWCDGERLIVSNETHLLSTLIAYGIDSHRERPDFTRGECQLLAEIILNVQNIRASNSAFDAVMVAKGKYGGFLNRTSKLWDNVAQHVVIEEAGGVYTDFFGRPLDYSDPFGKMKLNYTFCAAPLAIHRQLQKIIHTKRESLLSE